MDLSTTSMIPWSCVLLKIGMLEEYLISVLAYDSSYISVWILRIYNWTVQICFSPSFETEQQESCVGFGVTIICKSGAVV